jgi:hypothetical protein
MDNPETLATLGKQVTGQTFLIVPLVFSTLCPVLYVPNVASVSGLSILDCPFGFL